MTQLRPSYIRRKAVWGPKRIVWPLLILLLGIAPAFASAAGRHYRQAPKKKPGALGTRVKDYRLDAELEAPVQGSQRRGQHDARHCRTRTRAHQLPERTQALHVAVRRSKASRTNTASTATSTSSTARCSNCRTTCSTKMASYPDVFRVHLDRPIKGHVYRTSVTVGARTVQETLGYTGKGISVAVIDSGITTWHDDLTNKTSTLFPVRQSARQEVRRLRQRSRRCRTTTTATAATWPASSPATATTRTARRRGIAPGCQHHLAQGARRARNGHDQQHHRGPELGGVNATTYNIKVVNMSVGAGVTESVLDRPVDAGL